MAKRHVLDETRIILEIMGESEEKVSLMREDLNQNNTLCQQIKDKLKELRELRYKHATELEENQHLKYNIQKFNQQLLSFEKLIYHYNQELYSDLNSHDAEVAKNEELLYKNKTILEEKSNKYEKIYITLKQQLESLEEEAIEDNRKKELDSKTLAAENEELEAETKMLIREEEHEQNYIKNEMTVLDDEEKRFKAEIIELQECVKCTKNEIEKLSDLLKAAKQLRSKLEYEAEAKLLDWDRLISESEIHTNEGRSTVNNCQLNIDVISRKIEVIEENIKNKENECNNYMSEINSIETNFRDLEENCNKTIIYKKNSGLEIEEKCKQHQHLREQIEVEICNFKNKIEDQQECVDKIMEFLAGHKTNIKLSAELEDGEENRKNLKMTHQQLKQDYDKKILDLEAELKRDQEEIEIRDQTNKKLQDNIDCLILKLDQLKNEVKDMFNEIEQQNKDIEKLDSENKSLDFEVAETTANKLKNKKNSLDTNIEDRQASSTSTREKKKRVRHWDSDSSLEGEDRRLSELVRQKMKMKKMGKTHIHK